MKYELQPDNRNCEDEVLLNDLRSVASLLHKPSISKEDYDKHGRFSASTLQKRFGSWNVALEKSGLSVQKRVNISQEELLVDLKHVAEALEVDSLSVESYKPLGKFSSVTIQRAFGSWIKALEVAGLKVSPGWNKKISQDELFDNMATVWEQVGRQPKQSDFCPPISSYSHDVYVRRFGSWRGALESFVNASNQESWKLSDVEAKPSAPIIENAKVIRRDSTRDPSWRLRFLVMRRDRFTCQACGRTPALVPGLILHVDHVKAWSKGGETIFENLQTLCEQCNLGKSDLPMSEG